MRTKPLFVFEDSPSSGEGFDANPIFILLTASAISVHEQSASASSAMYSDPQGRVIQSAPTIRSYSVTSCASSWFHTSPAFESTETRSWRRR